MMAVQVYSSGFLYLHLFSHVLRKSSFSWRFIPLSVHPTLLLFLLLNSWNYNFICHYLAFGLKKTEAPSEMQRKSMYVLFPDPYIGYTKPL
ncbi:hypothetical protein HanRHA438_Chr07g0303421 [Helianthus annuus]|uniref:Uncharacterized protein n=1 Tax=Helianthus annuus TaxID=4232 RepID=A0A251T248_HELAN|nr:hypothetical protein HanXRQr2_Chr07g0292951 [Helianthus annuus]KAJ0550036.1 hypothetical protein HanHA300_Chr07g0240841 [Helianthus annuus]KAJ0556631.1 hypothetical protein HanIR_Chr07g0316011 [Helianthus annuus]KAJ0562994.1 hypothetical protein HanHA89_Chr07g0258051 [Helianthus annuus]KAJ0728363.1 hypothetical protein HanLR1_Chr07g0240741 [Helianthus annuus]